MDSTLKTMNSDEVKQAYFNFSVDIALDLQAMGELASYGSEVFNMNAEGTLEPPNKSDLSVNNIFLVRDYHNPIKIQVVMITRNNGKGGSGSTEYTCNILSYFHANLYEETGNELTLIPLKLPKVPKGKVPTEGKSLVAKLNLSSNVLDKHKLDLAFKLRERRKTVNVSDSMLSEPIDEWVNSINGCIHWQLEQRAALIKFIKDNKITTLNELMRRHESQEILE